MIGARCWLRVAGVVVWSLLAVRAPSVQAQEAILGIKSVHQVQPDGSIDSTEEFSIRAESNLFQHGLNLRLPLSLKSPNGGRVRRDISDITVTLDGNPETFEVSRFGGVLRLRTGGDRKLKPGDYVFLVHYISRNQIKFRDGEDEIIVPVVPYNWSVPVQDATVDINLPAGQTATRVFASTGDDDSRTGSIIIRKSAADQVQVQTSKSLAPRNGMLVAVTWAAGSVQRPTRLQQGRELLFEYGYILAAGAGVALLGGLTVLAQLLGRRAIRASVPNLPRDIGPATTHFLHTGRIDCDSITAQVLGLANKGYLTIEETEQAEFILQRTWRETDLGLSACDIAVTRAFYENRPTRFSVLPQSAPTILLAQQNLQTAVARELERAMWRAHKVFFGIFWAVALIMVVLTVLLSSSSVGAVSGVLFMLAGGALIYASLVALQAHSAPGRARGGRLSHLLQATGQRAGLGGLAMGALGFLMLLFGGGIAAAVVSLGLIAVAFYLHSRCLDARHFGRARARTLETARQFIIEPPPTGQVVEINQGVYETFMPHAAAWGLSQTWAQRYKRAAAEMEITTLRPRWLASPRPTHDPEIISDMVFTRLAAAFEQAISLKGRLP